MNTKDYYKFLGILPKCFIGNELIEKTPKVYHEWDNIHLTKQERKGKSYEQMQELRKLKWSNLK